MKFDYKIDSGMKIETVLYLFFLSIFVTGCSSDKQSHEVLSCIDVRKNYPEKEIILTDIANVNYVHLNTDNDDYLYKGGIRCVTKNTIVVYDNFSGSVLFFSKDGNPKSRFNRKGQGPEEYTMAGRIFFDEFADDVFVLSIGNNEIVLVYSSTGEYKRKLVLPQGTYVNSLVSFDNESLFIYNSRADFKRMAQDEKDLPIGLFYAPFVRISKIDGRILDVIELYGNKISLKDGPNGPAGRTTRIIKCNEGILLCNPENDTVFLYRNDKVLIPVMCKTPLVHTMDPMVYLNNCVDEGNYQFMEIFTVRWEEGASPFPVKYLMRDKRTGEVFRQQIILPDYKGKDFFISPLQSGIDYENGFWYELDLIELKQAYEENKLSGKLKDIVATLSEEEDNNVFMLVNFE